MTKANRWGMPKVSYCNMRKKYPMMGANCFTEWLSFRRYWGGRIWNINLKAHDFTIDYRVCGWADMAFPHATKQDRKAVKDAVKLSSENAE